MGKRIGVSLLCGYSLTVLVELVVHFFIAQAGRAVVTPAFAARFANESAAVIAQLGLVGLIGAAFAVGAQVFEIARWSFLKQGLVHLLITAAVWVPIARLCWMPSSKEAAWHSAAGWLATYLIVWTIQYYIWRRRVRELNRSICRRREEAYEQE